MDTTPGDAAADDTAALRAENEELRRRNEALESAKPAGHKGWRNVLRSIAVVVLIVLGAVCALAAVPAIWGRNLVLNTDRYVETLTPLATNPGIQTAVVKAIDQQFAANVDIKGFVQQVLPARAAPLAGPIESAANSLVDKIATDFVESNAFEKLWVAINRAAHSSLVTILTGEQSSGTDAVQIDRGILTLNLAPVITAVKKQLVSAGLTVAANVPAVGATIQIAEVKGLVEARSYVKLLNHLANWLPLISLVCFALAILAAHRRRRTLVISALSVAAGMLVLAIGLAIMRSIYLSDLPLKYLTTSSAGDLFDTLVRFLRAGLRLVLVLALLICVIAWITGSSTSARGLRHGVVSASRGATSRWRDSRFATVVGANHVVISVGVAALGALVLVLWTNPGVITVLVIVFVTAILVLLVNSFKPPPSVPA
jgi:hypothetical protein